MGNRDFIISANAELKIDGVAIGFTTEPTNIRVSRDYFDVVVEQIKGPLDEILTSETMDISTSIAEINMTNLLTVWDQEGSTLVGGTFLALGTENGGNEHTLTITAKTATGEGFTYQNYYIFRAISMESGEVSLSRTGITTIPLTFRCLKDDKNNFKFGYRTISNTKL